MPFTDKQTALRIGTSSLALIDAEDISYSVKTDKAGRNIYRNTISKIQPDRVVRRYIELSFKFPLVGRGDKLATHLEILKACECNVSFDSGKTTITPTTGSSTTIQFELYRAGKKFVGYGGKGSARIEIKSGSIPYIAYSFTALLKDIEDADLPAETPEEVPEALVTENVKILVGESAYPVTCESFELDFGLDVKPRAAITAPGGIAGIVVQERIVQGKFNPDAEKRATFDVWGVYLGNGTDPVVVDASSPTMGVVEPGSRYKITLPRVTYTNISDAVQDGIVVDEIQFEATGVDDEFTIELW